MDECLPPVIRDNKYFMYPFFYYAYRRKNIDQTMNIKSLVYNLSDEEYSSFYNDLDTISRNRETDLNTGCLNTIIDSISSPIGSLLDIGCSNGFLLEKIHEKYPELRLYGVDIKQAKKSGNYDFIAAFVERLPFQDKSFDVVTCCHTLEHIKNEQKAINELKRITRKQLIIVVPCQRYYFYTLDEHINFYPFKEKLISTVNMTKYECQKILGDWFYKGYITD